MSARTGNSLKAWTTIAAAWLACFCSAMSVEYFVDIGGEIYSLRMGLVEGDSDLVFPPPDTSPKWEYVEKAVCFKAGSRVGVRIRWDPGEQPCVWAVTDSMLYSQLTSAIYWTESACDAPGGHGMHPPNDIHWFPESVPDFVDHARLIGEVVTCAPVEPPMFGGWTNKRKSEVFIVLDEPKPPMSPAWVTFLRYTCKWARYRPGEGGISYWDAETRTENDAAQRLTLGFFFQRPGVAYIGDQPAQWLSWSASDTLYLYHLKDILDTWAGGGYVSGHCVDASIVNALAVCSIGFRYLKRQIGSPAAGFITYPICGIGDDPLQDSLYRSFAWSFHSITIKNGQDFVGTTAIWDSCAAQKKDLLGRGYRNPPAFHDPDHWYWKQTPYWHTHVSGVHEGEHHGLVYDDLAGTWTPIRAEWWMRNAPIMFEDWIPSKVTADPRPPR
ncbi:MAG: hypothetical protein KIT74_04395 [Fimbriimonadales bacterium]|nr:hypothetical protein [Fimbriimonadales bacterium]